MIFVLTSVIYINTWHEICLLWNLFKHAQLLLGESQSVLRWSFMVISKQKSSQNRIWRTRTVSEELKKLVTIFRYVHSINCLTDKQIIGYHRVWYTGREENNCKNWLHAVTNGYKIDYIVNSLAIYIVSMHVIVRYLNYYGYRVTKLGLAFPFQFGTYYSFVYCELKVKWWRLTHYPISYR